MMRAAVQLLYHLSVMVAAVLLTRRWPLPMRRVSRHVGATHLLAILCIITTGCLYRPGLVATVHRWLPHGLLIMYWQVVPLPVGVALAHPRRHPITSVARA